MIRTSVDRCRWIQPGQIRRVAVIGAGPSGLAAAKECLERGLQVTVFERGPRVGGNWAYGEEPTSPSPMYRSVTANVSRPYLAYSDFPMPSRYPVYPRMLHMAEYFQNYADAFGVTPLVKFGCNVLTVEPRHGGWEVVWEHEDGTSSADFAAVMVANGHHGVPRWPDPLPGQASFGGIVLHSHGYRSPERPTDMRGKRVLVVGIGNSACDIATELADTAAHVFLSTRSGGWVFPRWVAGRPTDQVEFESRFYQLWCRPALAALLEPLLMRAVRRKFFGRDGDVRRFGLHPHFGPYAAHAAVNDLLYYCIGNGSLTVKPALKAFPDAFTAAFVDGSTAAVDVVLFATGYSIDCPFLDPPLLALDPAANRAHLYKEILNPAAPPTLAFIGSVQPQVGFMPVSEMQARWVLGVWSGRVGLPSESAMGAQIEHDRAVRASMYVDRPRHSQEVEWPDYTDWLARDLGVMPGWTDYLRLPGLLLFEPVYACQYRLRGLGAKPAVAEATLRQNARLRRHECFNRNI